MQLRQSTDIMHIANKNETPDQLLWARDLKQHHSLMGHLDLTE